MPALVVGGVTIKITEGGTSRARLDNVDRSRAFDNTYRASVSGTAKRDFNFTTPPIPRATIDTYEATLGIVTPQTCSGDILGGSISCCSEITGWSPVQTSGGPSAHYVVGSFTLHEV